MDRLSELAFKIQETRPYNIKNEMQLHNFGEGLNTYIHEKDFHSLLNEHINLYNLAFELARLTPPPKD